MDVKENQSVKDRIIEFIMFKNISVRAFENAIGVANGYFSHLVATPKTKIIQQILLKFPELNRIWLLTGEGEMLKSNLTIGGDNIIQTVEGHNNQAIINKNKYSGKFAGIPEGSQMQYLMEQNKQLLQQNQKFQEHIDRLLGIIEDMNRGK